ncbi:MAG: creatininase family protein [Opitutaceae bacterium]|jgi:creatinine amidohydrolase
MSIRRLLAGFCVGMLIGQFAIPVQAQDRNDLSRWENPPAPPVPTAPTTRTISIPVEATVAAIRRHRAEYMNATQIAAALKAGRDVAILPIGGVRMNGLDMPLGTSLLVQHASAVLLAERWNAIAFPPIPFGAAPDCANSPGTVSIPVGEQTAYIRAVVSALLESGFNRVVLLVEKEHSKEMIALVTTLYRDTRKIVLPAWMSVWPRDTGMLPLSDPEHAPALQALAAAKILGHSELAGTFTFARVRTESLAGAVVEELRRNGITATTWSQSAASQPATVAKFTEADVDKAVEAMRQEARKYDSFPQKFATYQENVRSQDSGKPWSLENYANSVAKSYDDPPEKWPITRASLPAAVEEEPPMGPDIQPVFVQVKLDLPEEASPAYLRKHRWEYLTSAEMKERMKDDPVVILPCGAFEMHGPHGMLGTDIITAYSQAMMVAKPWNAIVLPPVYYTYAGATERWPGTVSVAQEQIVRYVKAVINSLLDNGFRRIVIMGNHSPGELSKQIITREIQQERGRVIFTSDAEMAFSDQLGLALGYASGEDNATLAGLKILGHPGVFAADEPYDIGRIKSPFPVMAELMKFGARGAWNMSLPTEHLAVRACVRSGDEDKMIPVMREIAAGMADAPKAMSRYLEEMEKARNPELQK